jgi:translation elongation factor EF-Ts
MTENRGMTENRKELLGKEGMTEKGKELLRKEGMTEKGKELLRKEGMTDLLSSFFPFLYQTQLNPI